MKKLKKISLFIFLTCQLISVIAFEKPITVVVTAFNNAPWIEKCFDNIFAQDYQNFNILCVDDGSTDGTADVVERYRKKNNLENKITLIRNNQQQLKLYNLYNAYHSVPDNHIIVQHDGDDWFPDGKRDIFKKLNKKYIEEQVWFVYSEYQFLDGTIIKSKRPSLEAMNSDNLRSHIDFSFTHLRTFYAWLPKLVKLQDLLTDEIQGYIGKFYPQCDEGALCFPMLEMAKHHVGFIPEVFYTFNTTNPLSGFKTAIGLQASTQRETTLKKSYSILEKPIKNRLQQYDTACSDIIIFSNNPSSLQKTIDSLNGHASNIGTIYVVYKTDNLSLYDAIKAQYPGIYFLDFSENITTEIKKYAWQILTDFLTDHVFIASDLCIINQSFDANECIRLLEKTFAYGFYLCLDSNEYPFKDFKSTPCQMIQKKVYGWKFKHGKKMWNTFNNSFMTLYRKKDILDQLYYQDGDSIQTMVERWQSTTIDLEQAGIFFESAIACTL
ncbi:MAG: glycosyltransferase family A protein [Candidatus Babeliales bacterium]